jgi:hypothetical protein
MIPAAALFINSARASNVFLVLIFAVSAWNGASFYVEVFGRKYVPPHHLILRIEADPWKWEADHRFEKELEKLRKEMELASATGSLSGPSTNASPWTEPASPNDRDMENSPLVLPGTNQHAADMEVPELVLEKAAATVKEEQKSDTLKVRNS